MEYQFYLPVNTSDQVSFETFITGSKNKQLIKSLKEITEPLSDMPFLFYLFGEKGSGKSHLLMSLCQTANELQQAAVYIDLQQHNQLTPDILSDLEATSIICLDGLEHIASSYEWQEAIFDLINRVNETQQASIVISGREPIASLSLILADLKSRLSWGLSYCVETLSDDDKQELIIQRAKYRGMVITPEVAKFLMNHCHRDTHSLMNILDKLDKLSLQQKRILSIHFIKSALSI
jgi:DnaA family protein